MAKVKSISTNSGCDFALLNNVRYALIVVNRIGDVLFANSIFLKEFFDREHIKNKTLFDLTISSKAEVEVALQRWRGTNRPIAARLFFNLSPIFSRQSMKESDNKCICYGSRISDDQIIVEFAKVESTLVSFSVLTNTINRLRKEVLFRKGETRRRKQSEDKIRLLLDSTAEPIFGVDKSGKCIFANYACIKTLEFDGVENLLMQDMHDLLHGPSLSHNGSDCALLKSFSTGEFYSNKDDVFFRKSGAFPVEYKAHPVIDEGAILGSVVSFTDITQRKAWLEEIKELNQSLEIKVKQRTEELSHSLSQLKQAQNQLIESEKMSALGGLVAGVAHEINTPIGVAYTASTFLDDSVTNIMQSEVIEQDSMVYKNLVDLSKTAQMIICNLDRASKLIRSFKQVAVDQIHEDERLFNLKEYLEEILFSLKPKYRNGNYRITVNCDKNIMLQTLPGVLSQIFTNLIVNSLIHGFAARNDGKIEISVHDLGEMIEFVFTDDGCGISEDHLKKIFDPFFTTNRAAGGTGLGLNIVFNLIVQKLAGQIECQSTRGQGAQFTFTIPNKLAIPHSA